MTLSYTNAEDRKNTIFRSYLRKQQYVIKKKIGIILYIHISIWKKVEMLSSTVFPYINKFVRNFSDGIFNEKICFDTMIRSSVRPKKTLTVEAEPKSNFRNWRTSSEIETSANSIFIYFHSKFWFPCHSKVRLLFFSK